MPTVQIKGMRELAANMTDVAANQIPFAVSKAMNATVKNMQTALSVHVTDVFDRPKPFTINAFGATFANKRDLTASVFVKDIQNKYLSVEAEGGDRGFKTFEQLFTSGGGLVALPGAGVKTDQYGNITKAQIKKIATELNSSGKAKRFFIGTPKGTNLPRGIYARVSDNHKLMPFLIFAAQANYKPRFKFYEVAQRTAEAQFSQNMAAAWEQAIKTMKT